MVADQKEMGVRSIKLMDEYNSQKSSSWFPASSNFYVRTSVKFTFANKIGGEAMHERSLVHAKRKNWSSLNFSFKLSTFYLAFILFTWLKFTCINLRSQKRVSGNQPLREASPKNKRGAS